MKNKVEIKSKDEDGKDVVVYVTRPSDSEYKEAQKFSSKIFKEAIDQGALLRIRLNDYMKEQGMWNEAKDKELSTIEGKINKSLVKLKKGGIKLKDARSLALDIRRSRLEQTRLLAQRRQLDEYTVEGQAENARFDYLVSLCVKDENNQRVFKDMDDYSDKNSAPFAVEAASRLAGMIYGLNDDWEDNLPENKFLKKFKFVDNDLRLVNEEGKHVSVEGHLVNEEGFFIDKEGNRIDRGGKRIDEDGLPVTEYSPYLDDSGKPIIEDNGASKE